MKKIYLLLFTIISIFIMSCSGTYFNPKYYYGKNSSKMEQSDNEETPPDLGGGDENLSPEEDPFQRPEVNDPNANGFTLDLDKLVIEASFDEKNRPTYKLVAGTWIPGTEGKNDYYYNGKDTTAAGYPMSSVKYYMYKQKNPTYDINSSYNQSSRMDRFYFYKFYGEYLSVGSLNYLIAIDKYTKLVFAYAVPTKWKNMIVRNAPETWGAVELGWEADGNVTGDPKKIYFAVDGIKYFYEYDPVGIVKQDGTIEIYQWCSDSIGLHNLYAPQFNGTVGDTNRPVATYNKPGRSPYMPFKVSDSEASEEDANKFKEDIKTLNNKEYKYRDYSGYTYTKPADKEQIADLAQWSKDYAGKSLVLYTYSLTDNGETITIKQEHFTEGNKDSSIYKLSVINSADKATYTNVNNPDDTKSVILMKNEEGTTIEALSIGGTIIDFAFVDYGPVFVDRVRNARFEYDSKYLPAGNTYIPGVAGTLFGGTVKNIVYQFNADGTSFTLTYYYDGKQYTYENKLARFDSDINNMWAAKYESTPGGSGGNYLRIVLRDNDQLVRSSMTLHSLDFWEDPTSDLGLEMLGNRK